MNVNDMHKYVTGFAAGKHDGGYYCRQHTSFGDSLSACHMGQYAEQRDDGDDADYNAGYLAGMVAFCWEYNGQQDDGTHHDADYCDCAELDCALCNPETSGAEMEA